MSISRFVGCQSCKVAERNSPYWLAFSAIAAGTGGMFSTTRLSPGLITAGWAGGVPRASNNEGAIERTASIPGRNLTQSVDASFITPSMGGARSLFPLLITVKLRCASVFLLAPATEHRALGAILPSQLSTVLRGQCFQNTED